MFRPLGFAIWRPAHVFKYKNMIKRNAQTVVQTINLADRSKTKVPKPIQRVQTFAEGLTKKSEKCSNPCRIVPVRICTREDLKKICNMKLCDCEDMPPPLTLVEKVIKATIFTSKSLIATIAVYYTYYLGLWGDSKKAEEFYMSLRSLVVYEESDFPPRATEKYKFHILHLYNTLIQYGMKFVMSVPVTVEYYVSGKGQEEESEDDEIPKRN